MFELKELSKRAVEGLRVKWMAQLDEISETSDVSWLYGDYEGQLSLMHQHGLKVGESRLYSWQKKRRARLAQ